MDEISTLLDEEIKAQVEALDDIAVASDEMSNAVSDLERLYRLRIEEKKLDQESKKFDQELTKEETRQKEQKLDRWIKTGVDVAGIVLPLTLTAVFMGRGFKFEETGSYCSQTFKLLHHWIKPTRK